MLFRSCFPTKAVAIWQGVEDEDHQHLVALYLNHAGFAAVEPRTLVPRGRGGDPLWAVVGRAALSTSGAGAS